jgi:2-methylcitrate dehydratase PrpD
MNRFLYLAGILACALGLSLASCTEKEVKAVASAQESKKETAAVIDRIAKYIHPTEGLQFEKIPPAVIQKNKWQLFSFLGTILHGKKSPYFSELNKNYRNAQPLYEGLSLINQKSYSPQEWAFYLSTISMFFDYDDFLVRGHTGHSSIVTPLVFSKHFQIDGKQFLTLQTIGNELGGRMGSSMYLGPQNGQLWIPIHQLVPASQLARLRLSNEKTDKPYDFLKGVVSLSLSHPVFGLWDSFFSSSSKMFTASLALKMGIETGLLGNEKISGPDVFIPESTFYNHFSYLPLLQSWDDLNEKYYTLTLSYKKYPGCAYITAPVEACEWLYSKMKADGCQPADIEGVEIHCNMLSKKMDDLSRPYLKGKDSTLTTLNFSLGVNCALMLLDGRLIPESFLEKSISRPEVWKLTEKISVNHDLHSTRQMTATKLAGLFIKHPIKIWPYVKKHDALGDLVKLPWDYVQGFSMRKYYTNTDWERGTASQTAVESEELEHKKANIPLIDYKAAYGAVVIVHLRNGKEYHSNVVIPTGFSGTDGAKMQEMVEQKLRSAVSASDYAFFRDSINNFESLSSRDVQQVFLRLQQIIQSK